MRGGFTLSLFCMMIKKYIVDEKGNIIDKTKNTIIGNSQGVFISDDGSTEMFFNYSINVIYYSRVCNISKLEALKIFGTVID